MKTQAIALLLGELPFGEAISKTFNSAPKSTDRTEEDIDQLALQNQKNFAAIVARSGVKSAEQFASAAPAMRVRYLMQALAKIYDQIDYPCPFTVYLLDLSGSIEKDANASKAAVSFQPDSLAVPPGVDEKQWKKLKSALKRAEKYKTQNTSASDVVSSCKEESLDISQTYVARLLGHNSKEYLDYNSYPREQKTTTLARAFKVFAEAGLAVVTSRDKDKLNSYLIPLGSNLQVSPTGWAIADEGHEALRDVVLVEKEFGESALRQFELQPEGREKDRLRVAAIVLFTQFQLVAAGLLAA